MYRLRTFHELNNHVLHPWINLISFNICNYKNKHRTNTQNQEYLAICAVVSIWLPIKLQLYCDRQLACQACGVLMTNTLFLKRFLPVNRRLGARRRIEESAFKDWFRSIADRSDVGWYRPWIRYFNNKSLTPADSAVSGKYCLFHLLFKIYILGLWSLGF